MRNSERDIIRVVLPLIVFPSRVCAGTTCLATLLAGTVDRLVYLAHHLALCRLLPLACAEGSLIVTASTGSSVAATTLLAVALATLSS